MFVLKPTLPDAARLLKAFLEEHISLHDACFKRWFPKLGVPYWGPHEKGILLFGGV